MKTLLVVDDHPIVLEGIQSVLSKNGFKVLKASTASQALALAGQVAGIDMYVVDLSLVEGTDGLDLVEKLRERGLYKPTVIYTMHEELWNISILMKADVEGIVLKGDNINELLYGIKSVADGERYMSAAFDEKRREALNTNGILSSKDIEILRRLSSGEGNKEIAADMQISEKTVEYHRSNILRKLCAKTMLEATKRAIALGIIYVSVILAAIIIPQSAIAQTQPEAVDLGLSVYWADRNLGAESMTDCGGYFAFGELVEKEVYGWENYSHCNGEIGTCHDLGTGTISATAYDAAAVILGNGWRLPTAAECEELIQACGRTMEVFGEMKAAVFTAPNGNRIILPFGGSKSGSKTVGLNKNGVYTTSNCEYEYYSEAGEEWSELGPYSLLMNGDVSFVDYGSPHLGISIRPVRDKDSSAVTSPVIGSDKTIRQIYSLDGRALGADTGRLSVPGVYIILRADGSREKILKK